MKIRLARLLSYFGKEQRTTGGAMSSLRFLPNTMSDYPAPDETTGTALPALRIPRDHLKLSINGMLERINDNLKPTPKNARDGVYLGTAGVAFTYYRLACNPALRQDKERLLRLAREYLKPALALAERQASAEKGTGDAESLILGACGVWAVAAAVLHAMGSSAEAQRYVNMYRGAATTCAQTHFLSCGSDELFVGRAGYVLGWVWLARQLGRQHLASEEEADATASKELDPVCEAMVRSGREYARRMGSPCPLMYAYYGVEYVGAAHGLCSVLQALLTAPGYLRARPQDESDVRACVDYLLRLRDRHGNYPADMGEAVVSPTGEGPGAGRGNSVEYELVHWCHGAPGHVYLLAKAYLTWHNERYVTACLQAGDLVWERGLLRKGPGICHGVAGNGYVFLLLYRLTSNPKFLHRAVAFAQFLDTDAFKRKARTPDHPYSLYEGIAGTVCFLADILSPDEAAFPFSDVF